MAEAAALATLPARPFRPTGAVSRVSGHEVEIRGLRLAVGDSLAISPGDTPREAEVVALTEEGARALVLGSTEGLRRGDRVAAVAGTPSVPAGEALLGRVIDALGRPLDGGGPVRAAQVPLHQAAPAAMARQRIDAPLTVGVRAVDTLCTVGRGQRMGIFAGAGVGKSTLLGMMVRGTSADVGVVALVGERGREVREFVEDELGPEGLARSVVVVATSDEPPLLRLRAGLVATRIAEHFADGGADVLLALDSLTRLAAAQREVGLAAGEPPTARGYTPSVFSMLPRLLERAGPRRDGTVTGFYTVLVEGDDMSEPVADSARAILDGHLVLDRRLATAGRYPAVDPLASLSRLASRVQTPAQAAAATAARAALAAAEDVSDLVEVGAYVPGTNPAADRGLALRPDLIAFLRQGAREHADHDEAWARLAELAARFGVEGGAGGVEGGAGGVEVAGARGVEVAGAPGAPAAGAGEVAGAPGAGAGEVAGAPGALGAGEVAGAPGALGAGEVAGAPGAPGAVEVAGAPGAPRARVGQGAAGAPGAPGAPGVGVGQGAAAGVGLGAAAGSREAAGVAGVGAAAGSREAAGVAGGVGVGPAAGSREAGR